MQGNRLCNLFFLVESKHASCSCLLETGGSGRLSQTVGLGVTQHAWFISHIDFMFICIFFVSQSTFYGKRHVRCI